MHKNLFILILFSFIPTITAQHRVMAYSNTFVKRPLSSLKKPLCLVVKQNLKHIHAPQKTAFLSQEVIIIPREIVIEHIFIKGIIGAESLNDAARMTSLFIQTNKKMYNFLNDDKNCLNLIKNLSKQFDVSNELVARTLQIKDARNRYYLQQYLYSILIKHGEQISELNCLTKDKVDVNFTYGPHNITPLPLATSYPNQKPQIARWLLKNGVALNHITKPGDHILRYICQTPAIFPDILNHPDFNVNFQDQEGNTILIFFLQYLRAWGHASQDLKKIYTGTVWLLENGADPELANNDKITPLSLVQGLDHTRFKDLIQEAIDKKYATKKVI